MRKFDFGIQTLLLSAAILLAVSALLIDKGVFILIWVVQFFMGCWQLISAIITSVDNNHGNDARTKTVRFYWLVVLIYFVAFIPLYILGVELIACIWFFSAWIIAIYYYIFTIKFAFGKYQERKTYLDIAN
jgi:hypothetical protein